MIIRNDTRKFQNPTYPLFDIRLPDTSDFGLPCLPMAGLFQPFYNNT